MSAVTPQEELIFNKVRQMPAAERAAYVEQACAGDVALARRIDALLAVYDKEQSFLASPALAPFAPTITGPQITEKTGTIIGPYKLLEQIGEGGFGIVFMAEQQQPVRRKVALKFLKPGMDTRQVIARFEAERQALALMDHPNIAKVLDAGATESGRPFFVMELVKGVPITEYCDQHQLTPRERLELFVFVCHAVQHAHQKGIIHRDIKPSNVLVTRHDGTPVVKVIDFGVAKALGQQLTDKTLFTGFAQMIGTPLYMSPEQAELSGLDIDTRTDIYSLGVLLYELLTGTTPFDKERLKSAAFDEIRRMIREEEPPKPSTRLSSLSSRHAPRAVVAHAMASAPTTSLASIAALRKMEPRRLSQLVRGDLDWIVMKALEKDRNRRYETASGFALDIQRYLADEPVLACPPSAAYRFRKFARRNKAAFTIGTTVVVALLIAVVTLAVSNTLVRRESTAKEVALEQKDAALKRARFQEGRAKQNAATAEEQREKAAQKESEAKAQEKLARRRLYAAQMNLAMQAWEGGQPARLLQLLESQRSRFDEDDLRGFDWYYLWRLCQGTYRYSLPKLNVDNASPIAISPDGQTLASGHGHTVRLWDASTGRQIGELTGHRNNVGWLAFAPDGKTLASSDASVRLWDLPTGKERATLQAGQIVMGIQFTGDSRTLVLSGKRIKLWDVVANQELETLGESESTFGQVAVSPDGNAVVANNQSAVRIWKRDGNAWREAPPLEQVGYYAPVAISPDGSLLAVGYSSLKLYDLSTLQVRIALQGHTGTVLAIAFSRDGKLLASGSQDRTARIFDVSTGAQQACIANDGPVYGLALAPDAGVVAAMGTDAIRVWDVATPEPAVVLRQMAPVHAVAFSPDGKTLASHGEDGVTLWDPAEGRQITTFRTGSNPWIRCLAFSPDGTSLAANNTDESTIDLWDLSGQRLGVLNGYGRVLAWSSDGKWLAAPDDGSAVIWDVSARQKRHTLPVSQVASSVAFSPDAKTIAAGGQFGVVKLFDAESGHELNTLQRQELAVDWASALAFSPDGRKLATGNRQCVVHLWDLSSNQLDASLIGHTDAVRSLAFLDGGRTLATAGEDRTIRLWDVATGQERVALKGHEALITGVALAPDGSVLATSSIDGTVRLWRAAAGPDARAFKREVDPDDPHSPAAHNERGDRLWQYGRTEEAESAYRRALARLESLCAAFPDDPAYPQELVRSLLSLSLLLRIERDDHPDAAPARMRALQTYRKLAPQHQEALRFAYSERHRKLSWANRQQGDRIYGQMVELMPDDDPEWLTRAANHLANCADVRLRDPARAVALTKRVLELCEKRVNEFPANLEYRLQLGRAYLEWEMRQWAAGRRNEAEAALQQAVELIPELEEDAVETLSNATREHGDVPATRDGLARFRYDLGNLQSQRGQKEDAIKNLAWAAGAWGKLADDLPGEPAYRGHQAHVLTYSVAPLLAANGRVAEAEAAYRQAIADWEKLESIDPRRTHVWNAIGGLCNLLVNAARFEEAEQTWTKAVEKWPNCAVALRNRAECFVRMGLFKEAAAELERAYDLEEPDSPYGFRGHAILRLWVEDAAGYRNVCRRMLERFADSADAHFQHELAAVLAFAAQPVVEPSRAVAFAERAIADQKYVWRVGYLGVAHYRAGQFERAKAALEESLAIDPNWRPQLTHSALALVQQRLGSTQQAMAELGKAETARDTHLDAVRATGTAFWPPGWWEDLYGEILYNEASTLIHGSPPPDDPRMLVLRGRALGAIGRMDQARDEFARAILASKELASRPPQEDRYRRGAAVALRQHASTLRGANRAAEAVESLQMTVGLYTGLRAADDRDQLGRTLWDLAGLLSSVGRNDEAEQALRRAQAVFKELTNDDPKNPDYRLRLASTCQKLAPALARQGRQPAADVEWDNAVAESTNAIDLKPDASEAWSARAFVHFHRQQWAAAVSDFSKAIDLASGVHTNWWHRGHCWLNLARWDNAAADFGYVVDHWPEGGEGWYRRAQALAQLNEPEKALADLRQALTKGFDDVALMMNDSRLAPLRAREDFSKMLQGVEPNSPKAQNNLAWMLATCPDAALRDPRRAGALAAKAVDLQPTQGTYWNTLGAARYRAGEWDDSIEALNKSMELRRGGDAFDWYFLAMAEWQRGNKGEARKWFDQARDWTQKNAAANEELQRFQSEAAELLGIAPPARGAGS